MLPTLLLAFDGRHHRGRSIARVAADYPFRVGDIEGIIPAGFQTDLESVPRLAQWLLPRAGKAIRSAVVHDWLISQGGRSHHANRVMFDALAIEGLTDLRRHLIGAALWLDTSARTGRVRRAKSSGRTATA